MNSVRKRKCRRRNPKEARNLGKIPERERERERERTFQRKKAKNLKQMRRESKNLAF